MSVLFGINVAPLEEHALGYGCNSLRKGDETMNRESLNRGEANAFNFMIIPIVMAIVFFLAVHPYNSASSPSFYFSQVITCLLVP
ncbi:MAG: hypothetical protein H6Q48_124 [Deltaproteobacteria bacterium]|jgi:hypothetical protein|nr:hypothetical protein [Deltaproteobacteria bacterium]